MRRRITFTVVLMLAGYVPWLAAKDASLQELEAKADAARLEDRPQLYLEIAQRQLKNADESYKAGRDEEGRAAVDDVARYAGKACDASAQSGKKMKSTEIVVRKMADRLRDIKRAVNFDDQAPVEHAIDQLEKMRTDLLSHMFGKGKS